MPARHVHGHPPPTISRSQRHDDEDGQEPVDAVEQPAMARDQRAAVLHAGAALGRRFDEVAHLPDDRQARANGGQGECVAEAEGIAHGRAGHGGPGHAAEQSRPGLARADARGELGAARRAPDDIGADVGRPDAGHDPDDGLPAITRLMAQPQQRDNGSQRVDDGEEAQHRPSARQPDPFRRSAAAPPRRPPDRSRESRTRSPPAPAGRGRPPTGCAAPGRDAAGHARPGRQPPTPPYRRSRRRNSAIACSRWSLPKSGHSVSTNTSSA